MTFWPPELMCILPFTNRAKFDLNTTPGTEDMASYFKAIFSYLKNFQCF